MGGRLFCTHASKSLLMLISWAIVSRVSLLIRGKHDWLNVRISTRNPLYLLIMVFVSLSVLKEFMRTRGTLVSYFLFRYSIWVVIQ